MAMKKHKEATAQEQSCAVASFLFFRVERTDQNEDSADHIDCRDRSRARRPLGSSGSALSGGFNSDILPWNPCTATACKFPAKNTRNFFEVLLTLFEPPVEFNADITRPAFGTHPAAVLASVLPLSADR